MAPKIALFIEGRARQGKLEGLEGDGNYEDSDGSTDADTGSLWYLEELDQNYGSGEWFPGITLSRNTPTGATIRNVRKFVINLSGISLRTGIRIRF